MRFALIYDFDLLEDMKLNCATYYKQSSITCSLVPSSRSQCLITTGMPTQKCNHV